MVKSFLLIFTFCLFIKGYTQERSFFPQNELTTVGAYYYPEHWDESQWERDLKKMSEMGFEFTHFAEFAWAQLEPEEGKYDFGWLDRAVALAAKYNLKVIMCTSTATPPVWLARKHPEGIMVEYRDGFGIALNYSDKNYEMELPSGTEILIGNKNIPAAGVLV
ncbi:MAG: beta-galactosidase [Mangrovibacterium sp.]